jgi:hypothetical protein
MLHPRRRWSALFSAAPITASTATIVTISTRIHGSSVSLVTFLEHL